MLNSNALELIRIGKKLKNIVIYDLYDVVDSFEFYKAKFFNEQYKKQIVLNNLNKRNAFN